GVPGDDGRLECNSRVVVGEFQIGVGNCVGGDLAGQLAARVPAHAVGDQKKMPAALPLFAIGGDLNGVGILIVATAKPDVGESGIFNFLLPQHAALRPPL